MQTVPEAPGVAFLGRHHAARVEKLGGAALPDDARQHGTCSHVAAGQADAGKQEGAFRCRRGNPQVRCHRQNGASPHRHAIDRRDNRLAAGDHRLDQIASQAREGEEVLHRQADQGTDNVMHITTRTKIAAIRTEYHDIDIAGISQRAKRVAKLGVAVEGQRVLALRTVEADGRDFGLDLPQEMFRG